MVILLMGVSGAGKTTVGQLLAAHLRWDFADADDYHSPANIEKMRHGTPLTDADRQPWLETLRRLIFTWAEERKNVVLACSALKQSYRDLLLISGEVHVVYLKVNLPLLRERLRRRTGHYMTEALLDSQLAALEEPQDAVIVNGNQTPDKIVSDILSGLKISGYSSPVPGPTH